METISIDQLRYPTGKFSFNSTAGEKEVKQCIEAIEQHPSLLRKAVKGLNDAQLDTPYRDGGWTVRQVVHHLADSHMNAYTRFKLALTEEHPSIKPYDENAWANLDDAKHLSVEISLSLLEPLHIRWAHMLKRIQLADYSKTVFHPESKRDMSVLFLFQLYAWHGKHHTAHITSLRQRQGW